MDLKLDGPNGIDAASQLRRGLLNEQLMGSMGNDAMLGAGVGASAVGLTYLAKLLTNTLRERRKANEQQSPVVRVDARKPVGKVASEQVKLAGIGDVLRAAVTGSAAHKVNDLPYALPLRAAALLAGAGGGAYLANRLGVNAGEMSIDNELEQARREFENALHENTTPEIPVGTETGPNNKLAAAFDRIEKAAAKMEGEPIATLDKKAAETLSNGLGQVLGIYALMAMLGGGTAAYYGYNSGVKGQKAKQYDLAAAAREQRKKKTDPYRPVASLEGVAAGT